MKCCLYYFLSNSGSVFKAYPVFGFDSKAASYGKLGSLRYPFLHCRSSCISEQISSCEEKIGTGQTDLRSEDIHNCCAEFLGADILHLAFAGSAACTELRISFGGLIGTPDEAAALGLLMLNCFESCLESG